MAKLYVTEFTGLPANAIGSPQVAQQPALVDQTPVTIGVSANPSAAFNTFTRLVRLHADAICSVAIGAAVVSTVNNARMAAGQTEYFWVRPGDVVSVIQNT